MDLVLVLSGADRVPHSKEGMARVGDIWATEASFIALQMALPPDTKTTNFASPVPARLLEDDSEVSRRR